MARGKHGAKAQARADQGAATRIHELEAELREEREAHRLTRGEVQNLRTKEAGDLLRIRREAAKQATENLTAEVTALTAEIELRKEGLRLIEEAQRRLGEAFKRCLIDAGLTAVEAHEEMLRVARHLVRRDRVVDMKGVATATLDSEELRMFGGRTGDLLTDDEVKRLRQYQVARGYRHKESL